MKNSVSATALHRHKKEHIVASLSLAQRAVDEVKAETLFERLRGINRETAAILKEARASNSPGLALQAIARVEKQIELVARLLGELNDSVKVAVGIKVNAQPSEHVRTLAEVFTPEELESFRQRLAGANVGLSRHCPKEQLKTVEGGTMNRSNSTENRPNLGRHRTICKVCNHDKREDIKQDFMSGTCPVYRHSVQVAAHS